MIKLLIVDDSPLMRRLLIDIFSRDREFTVEIARDGEEAIDRLATFLPDVITLDINMPGMDGLACLDRIMLERPCPVVMLSAFTTAGAEATLEAMALGAVDFFPKPQGAVSIELEAGAERLIETVRNAARVSIPRTTRLRERVRLRARRYPRRSDAIAADLRSVGAGVRKSPKATGRQLVLIGCSTGGPPALDGVLGDLRASFPAPIIIAQHMPASFTGPLARRLDKLCAIAVSEITGPTGIEPGHAYIGRGDCDVLISRRKGVLAAMPVPNSPDHHWHPSVDRLVESALRHVAAADLVGVLLTGMGSDGALAMSEMRTAGGRTIAEAEETAVVWGMPGALVRAGGAEFVEPLERISSILATLVA